MREYDDWADHSHGSIRRPRQSSCIRAARAKDGVERDEVCVPGGVCFGPGGGVGGEVPCLGRGFAGGRRGVDGGEEQSGDAILEREGRWKMR